MSKPTNVVKAHSVLGIKSTVNINSLLKQPRYLQKRLIQCCFNVTVNILLHMKVSTEQRTQEESKNAFLRSREELQRIQQNTESITGKYTNTLSHDITQAGLILEIVACLLGSLMDFTNREINMHHRTALCISVQQTGRNHVEATIFVTGLQTVRQLVGYCACVLCVPCHFLSCTQSQFILRKTIVSTSVGKYQGGHSASKISVYKSNHAHTVYRFLS